MIFNISNSLCPLNNGYKAQSSNKMHPTDQISTAFEYIGCPSKSSGALYHIVTTSLVNGFKGTEITLERPKSAIFKLLSVPNRIFYGLISLCIILFK
jgi:hypothetical protein